MCVLNDESTDVALPKWFRYLIGKNQDEKYQAHIISHAIERTFLYDYAEVPLYPEFMKVILTRKWTENDLVKHSAYINDAAGISPYSMMDLSSDDVESMQQEHEEIINASLVSTSKFKAYHSKLVAQTPEEAEEFILMLKRFTRRFVLLGCCSPFYRKLKQIMDAFQEQSPNTRTTLTMYSKSSIWWIILLQERHFAQINMTGETPFIGEFAPMVNLTKEKNCETISHVKVPTYPLHTSRKMQINESKYTRENSDNRDNHSPKKRKSMCLVQPYSA